MQQQHRRGMQHILRLAIAASLMHRESDSACKGVVKLSEPCKGVVKLSEPCKGVVKLSESCRAGENSGSRGDSEKQRSPSREPSSLGALG